MMALYGPSEQPITQTMPWRSVMDVYLSLSPYPRYNSPLPLSLYLSLMAMRDRAGMTTHKKASPILFSLLLLLSLSLSLSLIPSSSSSSAAMNCCSNGLCAFFLRIWTRERSSKEAKRERRSEPSEMAKRASGDLILIKRREGDLFSFSALTDATYVRTATGSFGYKRRRARALINRGVCREASRQ